MLAFQVRGKSVEGWGEYSDTVTATTRHICQSHTSVSSIINHFLNFILTRILLSYINIKLHVYRKVKGAIKVV